MDEAANYLDYLLRSGVDRQRLEPYVEQAKKLQAECGCALSGAFASITLIAAAAAGIARHAAIESPGRAVCISLVAIFAAGLLGKGIGIFVARIRMRLLLRRMKHVYVHQVG